MNAEDRRKKICELLQSSESAVSASKLASQFSVSRQIVVGDIAILRASGIDISATPRGYIIEAASTDKQYTIACKHSKDETEDELLTIVDNGGSVIDVIVDHSVYGQLSAPLHISSRYDVQQFIEKLKSGSSGLLSVLTSGIHLHTVSCKNSEVFERIKAALSEKGLLFDKQD